MSYAIFQFTFLFHRRILTYNHCIFPFRYSVYLKVRYPHVHTHYASGIKGDIVHCCNKDLYMNSHCSYSQQLGVNHKYYITTESLKCSAPKWLVFTFQWKGGWVQFFRWSFVLLLVLVLLLQCVIARGLYNCK